MPLDTLVKPITYGLGMAYISLCAVAIRTRATTVEPHFVQAEHDPAVSPGATTGAAWFAVVKPYCNSVEVETTLSARPAPPGLDGVGYQAACLALAGKIDRARSAIATLPEASRWKAAGIVFNLAHPVADAGDDASAGPIMAMVVDFWPNHTMALYHAGAAEAALGDVASARRHLTAFLKYYQERDGWRTSAQSILGKIRQ